VREVLLAIVNLLWFALLGQVLLSWLLVAGVRNDLVMRLHFALGQLLDPLMRPLRRILPTVGLIDITPLVAFALLAVVRAVIQRSL
jgi:YggT family protein